MSSIVILGAGPAGAAAALRAAELGAETTLVANGAFGGMAGNDGPVPVRALAHVARLIREARQLGRYGVEVGQPVLEYERMLARVAEVTGDVLTHSARRGDLDRLGVTLIENAGGSRFVDSHVIATETGATLQADHVVICTGGVSRRLPIPGFEFTSTHTDAWNLSSVPASLIVLGAGATGVQVASVFNAFGAKIQLFEAGPRILATEDEMVSDEVSRALRANGIDVREDFGSVKSFEKTAAGVRMMFSKNGQTNSAEAAVVLVAVGWVANTRELNLAAPGVALDARGFVKVDAYQRTTAPHVYAAGDVTGRYMLVMQAIHGGIAAATNAVKGTELSAINAVNPTGSFTDPEYAQVGLTEAQASRSHDVVVGMGRFSEVARTIIDGRTTGFCKVVVDRETRRLLGCHVVGERAVEIVQLAAVAIAAGMTIDDVLRIPFSFPIYPGVLFRALGSAAHELGFAGRSHFVGIWPGQ